MKFSTTKVQTLNDSQQRNSNDFSTASRLHLSRTALRSDISPINDPARQTKMVDNSVGQSVNGSQ